jgi:hypothetical protein
MHALRTVGLALAVLTLSLSPFATASFATRLSVGSTATYTSQTSGWPIWTVFDDGATADYAALTYTWTVLANDGSNAKVAVHITIDIPAAGEHSAGGDIKYFGDEAAYKGRDNDFSFVKRFNLTDEQKRDGVVVLPDENKKTVPMAEFPGPFHLEKTITGTVKLSDQTIRWDNDPRQGSWRLWTNPDAVPFEGGRAIPALQLWPDGAVSGKIETGDTSRNPAFTKNVQTAMPGVTSWIMWQSPWFTFHNTANGGSKSYDQIIEDVYDPATGLLAGTTSGMFVDDTLIEHFGLLVYAGSINSTMRLQSTNIQPGAADSVPTSHTVPALGAFATVTAVATLAAFARPRKGVK